MLFLFCCVGGVSETPPPFVGPALQLSPMELHRSRHSHDILRAADFRVVLAHMNFGTFMRVGRACVKNVYFGKQNLAVECAVFRSALGYVHLGCLLLRRPS